MIKGLNPQYCIMMASLEHYGAVLRARLLEQIEMQPGNDNKTRHFLT